MLMLTQSLRKRLVRFISKESASGVKQYFSFSIDKIISEAFRNENS